MLLAFVRAGDQVEFVPIQVIGKGWRSHIHPVEDTWRWLRWWRRVRLGRNNLMPPQMDTDKHR
jgi:hypothetical protein